MYVFSERDYSKLTIEEKKELLGEIVKDMKKYQNLVIKAASPIYKSLFDLVNSLCNNCKMIIMDSKIILDNSRVVYDNLENGKLDYIELLDNQRKLLDFVYLMTKFILEPMCNDESESKTFLCDEETKLIPMLVNKCNIENDNGVITYDSVKNSIKQVQEKFLSLTPLIRS